ncbi:MAG TPA: hypothetical protein PKD21_10890, partial [Candidatus Competibacter phosphatis]|nr:hypothetical protein [Candidatus Competibacter phosphatis]
MSGVSNKAPLLPDQEINSRQQPIDGMHKRSDFIREVIVGDGLRSIRWLLVQTFGHSSDGCQFTADNPHDQPNQQWKEEQQGNQRLQGTVDRDFVTHRGE